MKKLILRALLLLLALLTVIPLAGCQETPTPQETDPVTGPADTDPSTDPSTDPEKNPETDPETDPAEEGPELPEVTFGGSEFTILIRPDEWYVEELYVKVLDTKATSVQRAVYQRMSDVSSTYGVIFDVIKDTNVQSTVASAAKGQADAFDLVVNHGRYMFSSAVGKSFYDWNDLPYVDLSADWWSQDAIREFSTPGGKLFVAVGDISYLSVGNACAIWFNKDMLADVEGLASPYDLVRQNKWLFDTFEEYVVTLNANMDGDGTGNENTDSFGFFGSGWGVGVQMLYSAGCKILEWKNDDWSFPSKKDVANEALFDLRDLLYSSDAATLNPDGDGVARTAFKDRRAAFVDGIVHNAMGYAGLDLNYGLLPYPKYRKNVQEYYTMVGAGTNLYGVMRNTSEENAERISIILEAMAWEGHDKVLPLYYDTVLSYQALKDEDSIEMLHIIHDSLIWDFGYFYSKACNVFYECVVHPESGSLLKAVEGLEEATRQDLYDTWNALDLEDEE